MDYARNKKARFDYDILEQIEAGLILTGPEVKAVRAGQVKLVGGFVSFYRDEAFLNNAHISKYKYATLDSYDPDRSRKLLLSKKEIAYLRGKSQERGLTVVPLSIYTKGRLIKVGLGIGRGKKLHDKRRTIKKREQDREMRRAVKGTIE
jgi:SsrA-binding protein